MKKIAELWGGGLVLLGALLTMGVAIALEDSPGERARQAQRYLAAVPPKETVEDIAQRLSATVPADQRELFRKAITEYLDLPAFTRVMHDGLVKHFTADELKALADFYGSTIGKAAMKKLGVYTADVMPAMQAEITRAVDKASKTLKGRPGKVSD
jgi:hypothetical protein